MTTYFVIGLEPTQPLSSSISLPNAQSARGILVGNLGRKETTPETYVRAVQHYGQSH